MLHREVEERGVGSRKVPMMQAWPLTRKRWSPARCQEAPPIPQCQRFFLWLKALCLLKCKFLEKRGGLDHLSLLYHFIIMGNVGLEKTSEMSGLNPLPFSG